MRCTFPWMSKAMRVLVFLFVFVSAGFGGVGMAAPAFAGSARFGVPAQQPDAQQSQQPKQTDEFIPVSQLPPQDQLPAAPLLVTAYSFVWLVLFGYLVSLARRLGTVQREVERLESDVAKRTRT